ncbi:MAG: hypothetical protein FJZ87_15290 [Chloroflexi bacterium]|nr:hypothetical protein [Chloroflexota bacterium]
MMKTVKYQGHECCQLTNRALDLLITRSVGPRILSLRHQGGENLFAELPDFVADCPGSGPFHFYGGHRLWHAPEDPCRTYQPDDSPVEIIPQNNGLLMTQNVEARTSLQKFWEIRLPGDVSQVVITHHLTNRGLWPVTCAPWAITQFKVGGIAILPQTIEDTGVLPNRSLVFWPYTPPVNPNVHWGRRYVLLHANMNSPFKVGYPNPRGWLAYWLNGTLFVKRAAFEAQSRYYDFGSSSECYCNDQFIELETLAPITTIEPGATTSHLETWELFGNVKQPHDEEEVQSLVDQFGLE